MHQLQTVSPRRRGLPLPAPQAVLQPVRFGEFLRDQRVITEEQWLAALAAHWSERRGTIGRAIADQGFLAEHEIEGLAAAFHDLDVVEVDPT